MNKEQLGEVILETQESLYRVAKTMLRNDDDCEDAICETIAKAFEKLHTLKSDVYVKTWLTRILINECYNVLRFRKKVIFLEDGASGAIMEGQDYSPVYEAIGKLPEKARLVVALYYLEGYSVREVAKMMKTTESAVKNRLARARERLKQYLDEDA